MWFTGASSGYSLLIVLIMLCKEALATQISKKLSKSSKSCQNHQKVVKVIKKL
jgi:hypothetical protein